MTPVIEQIHSHRSIRKFKNRKVDQKVLDQILLSSTKTSSSGNMQAYSIIVTRDHEMKRRMYRAHFEQEMLIQAPVFLTFCADFYRMRRWLEVSQANNNFDNYMSFMIASIDAILASQSAALAAESLGLGLCYMGTTLASAAEVGEILELPENVIPVVGFALGHPDESPQCRERLPMEAIVHEEKYQVFSDEKIEEIYRNKNTSGMKRYLENEQLKEKIELSGVKNLAQVYTQVKYTEKSHLEYSEKLLNYLEKQNFI